MKSKWLVSVAVLLALAAGMWWLRQESSNRSPVPAASSFPVTGAPGKGGAALGQTAKELASAQTPEETRTALARLRQALATSSTNEISAAIRRLLDSKLDAATGQGFKLGASGVLLEAPTLRTLLLNQLETVDPEAAAAYARDILKSPTSPEEWAVALQALGRNGSVLDDRTLMRDKTAELLRNTAWQKGPSVAYLEAFDVAVFVGGTDLLLPLSELARLKDNQAVAHAAFLALDRLVINQPTETLSALAEHPEWLTGREQTRANYFARADVSNFAQRRLIEDYLLAASLTPAELQTFAGVFPNANFMISHNLLTPNVTVDGVTLARRDNDTLLVVNEWVADPRFAAVKPQILGIQQRLQEFVRESAAQR